MADSSVLGRASFQTHGEESDRFFLSDIETPEIDRQCEAQYLQQWESSLSPLLQVSFQAWGK